MIEEEKNEQLNSEIYGRSKASPYESEIHPSHKPEGSFSEYFALRGDICLHLDERGNQWKGSVSYSKARYQT